MAWYLALRNALAAFLERSDREELGASLVEYALLLALIAVVAITALVFLGHSTSNQLNNVANRLK